jgi:threonine synthase
LATFFSHLECSVPCGVGPYDPRQVHQRCTCGAPLLARYDLTAVRRIPRSAVAGREASMWRYRELMPLLQSAAKGVDLPISLGEGWTPLIRARRLGSAVGLKRVYLKDEARNPTGSWKARGLSAAITRAMHLGAKEVVLGGGVRAGEAAGAYAARAGLKAQLRVSHRETPDAVTPLAAYGASVRSLEESVDELAVTASAEARANGWVDLSTGAEPYRLEGQKTLGFEIAEQLGWEVPDWILCPSGSGATIAGLAKAFLEMAALGWIDPVRRPHLVAVQAAGCAPLVRAVAAGSPTSENWTSAQTRAAELAIAAPALDRLALRAIRETGGTAIGAGDREMSQEADLVAGLEGISAPLGTGAAVHALRVLAAEGRIKPHDTIVIINPAGR